ncbi:sulfur oxidation c-type cytochrome SoxA [Massilia sp. Root351]|jgi:sulfur-oxidizing protein SoxA|uniref:sulfur oxidation c-type cytochrome SoxA n=1 Tax=Massilia sp. Root351 TaxID=1736522 RepID=UPI000709CB08|nr:sulfur oxidation c-type cytochrome SoxA [Massilia sp. Root351]KQV89822.1 sulfur oxidation c-type cytochrome SoxA [Massilia sp. Root351]
MKPAAGPVAAVAIAIAVTSSLPAHARDGRSATQDTRKSGAEFMGAATQAMQRDDTQNPAMLWISGGEALWNARAGKADRSCASCHGDAKQSMRGVAARFPAFDKGGKRVITLGQRIDMCRQGAQQAAPLKPESDDLLSLESYVAMQSRGMPVNPPQDPGTRAAADRGRQLYRQRIGQLNLSCAQCHDDNWGRKLAGATIPQGHANAYPIYRLEWQAMGSLQRRLRNCMSGVRAEVPAYGAQDLVDLEAFLSLRARGMALETPGVRP